MPDLAVGSTFADCVIEGIAGAGGMGVVYRARQVALDRQVAVKLISPQLAGDASFRERFQRESRIAASIDHPNVIPVYEAGEQDGQLYLVMKYVEGTDLGALIRREGRLAPERAAAIVAQIADALDSAHASGLVHRDIKPGNVLIADAAGGERVYLTDFGLTKRAASNASLTGTGRWVGTLHYVSPEQVQGLRVDARADIYSLGCLLYEALTASVPFEREDDVATMFAHLQEEPPAPSLKTGDPCFDDVVRRAMAKAPADRFQSAGDLGRAALAAAADRAVSQPERSVAIGAASPESATPPAPTPLPPASGPGAPPAAPEPSVSGFQTWTPGAAPWKSAAPASAAAAPPSDAAQRSSPATAPPSTPAAPPARPATPPPPPVPPSMPAAQPPPPAAPPWHPPAQPAPPPAPPPSNPSPPATPAWSPPPPSTPPWSPPPPPSTPPWSAAPAAPPAAPRSPFESPGSGFEQPRSPFESPRSPFDPAPSAFESTSAPRSESPIAFPPPAASPPRGGGPSIAVIAAAIGASIAAIAVVVVLMAGGDSKTEPQAPPPASDSSRPDVAAVPEKDVRALLQDYADAYSREDIAAMADLMADDVVRWNVGDPAQEGKQATLGVYRGQFAANDTKSYSLGDITIENKAKLARANARYTIVSSSGQTGGTIRLDIAKADDAPLIHKIVTRPS